MNTPFEQYIRSRLIIAVAIVLGIGFAVFAGKLHGSGKTLQLFIIFGAIALTVTAVKYQEKLWVLIPICWTLTGKVSVLPVPFSVRDLVVMYVAVVMVSCIALKIVRTKPKYTSLDVILLLNLLWLLGAFIRNPVGVAAFDSDRVGGKPYFDALIAFISYLVLIRIIASPNAIRRIPFITLGVVSTLFLINGLIFLKPSLAPVAMALYSGFHTAGLMPGAYSPNSPEMSYGSSRFTYFVNIGNCLFSILCSYFNPLKVVIPLYWKQFSLFCFANFAILISGFRSVLMAALLFFFLATYFQRGWLSATRTMLVPVAFAFLLMLGHRTLYELPYGAQRTMAIIPEVLRPTKFDPVAVNDAESSTRWRMEMWEDALKTNKYIANKWLGDGFGLTKWQLQVSQSLTDIGQTWEDGQEGMAIAGLFHSGPVSTIRYVGYIGLLIMYVIMIMMARMGIKVIRMTKDSPFFSPALLFGIPIILYPFLFTFIFGAYDQAILDVSFGLGVLKLLENSFNRWSQQQQTIAADR